MTVLCIFFFVIAICIACFESEDNKDRRRKINELQKEIEDLENKKSYGYEEDVKKKKGQLNNLLSYKTPKWKYIVCIICFILFINFFIKAVTPNHSRWNSLSDSEKKWYNENGKTINDMYNTVRER